MRCPKCDANMPVGSLYCEQCGEDIHIVPDFEPEVELNIEQTISGIADDIDKGQERHSWDSEDVEMEMEEQSQKKSLQIVKITLILIMVIAVFLLMVAGVMFAYQYHSVEFQTDKAIQCVENAQYDRAIMYYKRALELSDNEISISFKLAEVYFLKNDKIEYESLLRQIVENSAATKEQLESAYGKLIAIYRAREDFESINELLLASNDEQVMKTYQNYVAMAPEFSIQEGYYSDVQLLKLTAYGTGKIYYTLDGSEPDESSEQYIVPIVLNDGDYTVCACFVNEYGIVSEYVTKNYHIEIAAEKSKNKDR